MKTRNKLTAMILTLLMIVPLFSAATFTASAAEASIMREDFERFSDRVGMYLTKDTADGIFKLDPPSSTCVAKDEDNTYLTVDFASLGDPNKTVHFIRVNGDYQLVEEGTPGATTTDEASFGLISGIDNNLDKNIIVNHESVDYTHQQVVLLEAKYYLSEDAKGVIQGQLHSYAYEESGNQKKGNWMSLFRINAEQGTLEVNGKTVPDADFEKGGWTTLSIVIDMTAGLADFYINYIPVLEKSELGYTYLSIDKNSFICAKIPRTNNYQSNASNDLKGSFAIDDVRVAVPSTDAVVTVEDINQQDASLMFVEFRRGEESFEYTGDQRVFLRTDGWEISPVYFDDSLYKDVITSMSQIEPRLVSSGGIRFINSLNPEKYEALKELETLGVVRDVSFGTIITPSAYVREAKGFTVDLLNSLKMRDVKYLKVEGTDGEWYGEDYTFAGSIGNILPSHYDADFNAVGYVSVTFKNGETKYYYGNYTMRGGVSMMDLAESTLKSDAAKDLTQNEIRYLRQFKYTPFDVGKFGLIQNVYVVNNTLLFDLYHIREQEFDTSVSITYIGGHGWRIKAAKSNGLGVESFGAAQALAAYMGEELKEEALPLTLKLSEDEGNRTLFVYAPDGNSIEILKVVKFCMYFKNSDGKTVTSIRDFVAEDDGTITMTGGLVKVNEGVYGGGERFDTTNKINKGKMDLYTLDRWNRSDSTYMAIPFFVTTSGAGIYINRYERMQVQFVSASDNYWKVHLENPVMDCYIFASGDMKDAYIGYTKLTGNADTPEEWAYGVMLCRYSSDLTRFEEDNIVTGADGAPMGRSVKTLVTKMIAAGMKPSAVIMEAWNYHSISTNPEALAELQATSAWLEEQGIKAMLYMRVGGSFNFTGMQGFKEEYLLHAYVNNSYTARIPDISYNGGNPDVSSNRGNYYLDITNPYAVKWFYDEIWGQLIDLGIDGVKIDFCETMPDEFYDYSGTVVDYKWYDPTKIISGTEHHAYPVYFISTFYNRMNELKEAKGMTDGFTVLSRGGGIGSQRNPYLWAGDQTRTFDKLDDALLAVVNSGLSGVPFMTYDMAGYRYSGGYASNSVEYESAVFSRAVEFSAFTTNIQTHGTVRNAYELTEQAQQIYRNFTGLHEDLYPYINQYVKIACETGIPVVRHLVLNYQDDRAVWSINDQFMLGEGILVAPILKENITTRQVYLPKGEWTNLLTGEVITGGQTVTVEANIGQIPVFLNNADKDADALRAIFEGENWQAIQNFEA